MVRLIVFDLGKVLVNFDFNIAVRRLKERCPVDMVRAYSLFKNSDLAENWDKGEIPPETFFATIQKEMRLSVTQAEFRDIWNGIFTEKTDMIELARSLNRNNRVYVLSNVNPWHAEHLRKTYPWLGEFDGFIASCDVKLVKPDPAIFRLVLKKTGTAPGEVFYVDDIAEHVRAARKLGIDGHVFKGASGLVEELNKRNLLEDGAGPAG